MHIILACVLTILGTLWTPEYGFQMEAVNETQTPVTVTGVRVVYLKPGVVDDGEQPDPKNMLAAQLDATATVLMDTGIRVNSVMPKQRVFINFDAPFTEDRFIDGDAVCEEDS